MNERSSTWYEDMRRDILYTCEERFDGSMVMFVKHLQDELKKVQAERDVLLKITHNAVGCKVCAHDDDPHEHPACKDCGILGKNWVWRGIQERKGGNSL